MKKVYNSEAYNPVAGEFLADIELKIDGLIASADGTFTLKGVRQLATIDYPAIANILQNAGMELRESEELADQFAELIFENQITKVLAKRITRSF